MQTKVSLKHFVNGGRVVWNLSYSFKFSVKYKWYIQLVLEAISISFHALPARMFYKIYKKTCFKSGSD